MRFPSCHPGACRWDPSLNHRLEQVEDWIPGTPAFAGAGSARDN
jgi:hypothetical protein